MSFRPFLHIVVFASLLVMGSCSDQESESSRSTSDREVSAPVEFMDEGGFRDLVHNRDGRILLINVWATWCIPCREEFPDLVKIANEYQNKNVEVVGISADFPDEVESKIKPFLKSQNASFKNYVKNFEDDGAFINSVNPEWSGALPATFVYDTKGILRESHVGKSDFEGFKTMIERVRQAGAE